MDEKMIIGVKMTWRIRIPWLELWWWTWEFDKYCYSIGSKFFNDYVWPEQSISRIDSVAERPTFAKISIYIYMNMIPAWAF